MLMDYCIGRAAVKVKELYLLPVDVSSYGMFIFYHTQMDGAHIREDFWRQKEIHAIH